MNHVKRLALSSLVMFILVVSCFAGTAIGASARYAVATEVVGTVHVTIAGGTKELRVFNGMSFQEGDVIRVGKGATLTLKVSDREDEIVLGENWNGALSKLRLNASGSTETAIHTWSGTMMNNVQSLSGTSGSYRVETPTASMGVRGTHFMVGIEPNMGSLYSSVLSGQVAVTKPGAKLDQAGGPGGLIVIPTQQIEQFADSSPAYRPISPETLAEMVPESVMASIIASMAEIEKENAEAAEALSSSVKDGEASPVSEDDFRDIIQSIINEANSTLSKENIQELLDAAYKNQSAPSIYEPFRPVLPSSPAYVNTPEYISQQAELEAAKKRLQQQIEAKNEAAKKIADSNQALIQQIIRASQQQAEKNAQKMEEKQKEALERLQSELTEAQRIALEQRVQQKEDEKRKQEQATKNPSTQQPTTKQPSTPTTGGSGGGNTGGPSGPAPLSTSTTLTLDRNEIYAGESFEIKADVMVVQTGQRIPDPTKVTFRNGLQEIASGTTSNGAATAVITPEASLAQLNVGVNYILAYTHGTSTTQANTSFPISLKVKQDETTTTVAAPHREAAVGETVPFTVTVTPKHGKAPATGIVKLYDGDNELGSKELDASGKAVFDVLIQGPASDFAREYKAVFVGTEKQAASEGTKNVYVTEISELPAYAYVDIVRVSDSKFNVVLSLDRFTGEAALYDTKLELVHSQGVEPQLESGSPFFNIGKFDPATVTEAVYLNEGEHNGEAAFYTEYEFSVNTGAVFDTEEVLAIIPFIVVDGSASADIEVLAWRFYGKDENPIEVRVNGPEVSL